jgi:hypothetical protein
MSQGGETQSKKGGGKAISKPKKTQTLKGKKMQIEQKKKSLKKIRGLT